MKRRTTFFHQGGGQFDPSQLSLTKDSLTVTDLHAARQERLTFGFDEIPEELATALEGLREVHVRWAAERAYEAAGPFSSRVSPGLHVLFAPGQKEGSQTSICTNIRKAFGDAINCSTSKSPFTEAPGPDTELQQFYQPLPSLDDLAIYAQQVLCPDKDETCATDLRHLHLADSLDIDYDSTARTLTVTAFWDEAPTDSARWEERISKAQDDNSRVEVGVLALQEPVKPEKLFVGGFLVVVGEHEKLKPTLFSFSSRHHPLPWSATYETSFQHPTGLHPTMQLSLSADSLSRPPAPPESTCSLHAYLTLPSAIFADKYQLSTADAIYLDSHNLKSLQSITGELDLEAPDWTLSKWGSSHLLELATQRRNPDGGLDATVPLHLRYLHPSPSGYRNVSVPWPVVFWACSGTKKEASPFDRKHLGYDALFEPNTLFYNLHPQPKLPVAEDESGPLHSLLMENIQVPVLAISGDGAADWWHLAGGIEVATVAAVCAGFFWVLYKLCRIAVQPKTGRGAAVGSDKKTN